MLIYWLKSFVPDGKLIDGQVIQLEDGSAAYVQHVPIPKSSKYLILTYPPDPHTAVSAASSCLLLLNGPDRESSSVRGDQ